MCVWYRFFEEAGFSIAYNSCPSLSPKNLLRVLVLIISRFLGLVHTADNAAIVHMTMQYEASVLFSYRFKINVYCSTFHTIVLLELLPDYAKTALFPFFT